ncbi:MAG: ABC transporter ATP-binding protein [Candidatus Methylacidiphilales bacterium]|nr:ABC transporter ATP-binding protein [Candidatus Methylacidiphilales bacterium]
MPVLSTQALTKHYGRVAALNGLDLSIDAGQVFGLLGPNGSGKTTFLATILDVLRPTSGTFTWFDGSEGPRVRRRIGALLETPNFYPYLDADQNLALVAAIKGLSHFDPDPLLELVQLKERRASPFKTYSLGMKQRLAIASCLVGDPDVLILDEPTNGLDPEGMIEVRRILLKIASQGKTIVLASHILDEVEKICSHVAILKQGRCLASGAVGSILGGRPVVEAVTSEEDAEKLHQLLASLPYVLNLKREGVRLIFELEDGHVPGEINRQAFDKGITLNHITSKSRSLEAEFLEITRS